MLLLHFTPTTQTHTTSYTHRQLTHTYPGSHSLLAPFDSVVLLSLCCLILSFLFCCVSLDLLCFASSCSNLFVYSLLRSHSYHLSLSLYLCISPIVALILAARGLKIAVNYQN